MRNIVCFDIETTGLDKEKDFIIQFAAIKYDRETLSIVDEYNTYIQPIGNYVISIGAVLKHHITPEFLKDKPTFVDVAEKIYGFIKDCDILGYNALGFDAPFLKRELHDCGIDWHFSEVNFYDSFLEEKRRNGNTLEDTFKRYKGKSMEDSGYVAHDAFSDVKATFDVFVAQNKIAPVQNEQILTEDGFINLMSFNNTIKPCFTVGKYKGVSVEYVAKYDKGYLRWVVNNTQFNNKTKEIVSEYLNGTDNI